MRPLVALIFRAQFSNHLEPKVAIITGAGQGIGLAIARQLASDNFYLVINDLDAELAQQAAAEVQAASPQVRCLPLPGDAGDLAFVDTLVATAVREFGRVDAAIANAGITLFGDFLQYSPEAFYKVMQVNLGGSFFLAQAAARQMVAQGSGGAILFMSSVTGHQAHLNLAAYGMSKAALEMLAKHLVAELGPHRIRVNAVAPGATLTERTLHDPTYADTWARITPLGRPATVDDIAAAAAFLVSDKARHITGQSLVIDGGWTSTSPQPY